MLTSKYKRTLLFIATFVLYNNKVLIIVMSVVFVAIGFIYEEILFIMMFSGTLT